MSPAEERALKMLNTALEMEEKGRSFYEKAITGCGTSVGTQIFEMLRNDEIIHVERIKQIYTALQGGGDWNEGWKSLNPDHAALTGVFRALAQKHGEDIGTCTDDIKALEVGIEFEEKAVTFYTEQLESASDALEKQFIEKMIVEETDHHQALVDMHFYLTDPESYFIETEKHGLDGA